MRFLICYNLGVVYNTKITRVLEQHMTINKRSLARAKARLLKQLHELLPFCRGTLSATTVTCGKPNCACAHDPARRHGPYFQWTVVEQGVVRHRTLRPAEAEAVRVGIARRAAFEAWCRRFARHMEAEAIAGVVKKKRHAP